MIYVVNRLENIVGKGENAANQIEIEWHFAM